jgi:hypothetical protein
MDFGLVLQKFLCSFHRLKIATLEKQLHLAPMDIE